MSGNAVAYGSRLRTPARWVRVLAFSALARRESSSMACGLLRRAHATSETSGSTDKAVTGYTQTLFFPITRFSPSFSSSPVHKVAAPAFPSSTEPTKLVK